MKATLKIDMDNAAFVENPGYELARILRDLADRVECADSFENEYDSTMSARDFNGNRVGELKVRE